MKGFLRSFLYAGRGIVTALSGRNFRFQLCAAAFVTYFAARFYQLSGGEWAALLLTFALVLSLEAVNTALEQLCDRVTQERDEHIRRCKDCAAGAVLISALFSVGVGIALFWDITVIEGIFRFFAEQPWRIAVLAIALTAAALFVFLPERGKK